jgi:ribosomal protein L11 methyltransferase
MSDVDCRGKRVVDLGTGSGVLAMAAMLSGAREVIAVDIDQDAIDSARASARLNPRVGQIHWLTGDFRDRGWDALTGGPFDVVLANLTGGMLMSAAARIRELMAPGGTMVCSGFDEEEEPRVKDALALVPHARFDEDRWIGLTLRAADASSRADRSSFRPGDASL